MGRVGIRIFNVSDAAASPAWRSTYTGGGTTHAQVRYNGSAWTIVSV
jgi:hypothetical protein